MTTSSDVSIGSAYGLKRPTVADVRAAIRRVYPDDGDARWAALLAAAGLTGRETDPEALRGLTAAMAADADPVLGLIARAQTVRMRSFEHINATHGVIASTPVAPR